MKEFKLNKKTTQIFHKTDTRENKIYLINTQKGWYRIFRQGQRSWEAVCVMPNRFTDYNSGIGVSVKGNKGTIMQELENFTGGTLEIHILWNEHIYRQAMMSIAGSGKIDSRFKVEFIKED